MKTWTKIAAGEDEVKIEKGWKDIVGVFRELLQSQNSIAWKEVIESIKSIEAHYAAHSPYSFNLDTYTTSL